MKTFLADLIPKIQKYSQQLDNLTLLTNQHWVVFDDVQSSKDVYIFRSNNELLISQSGRVEKAKWEYLGSNSILIDRGDGSYLFKHGFFDENVLALKIDGRNEYAILINETKYGGEFNSLSSISDFLQKKYVNSATQSSPVQSRKIEYGRYQTNKGELLIEGYQDAYPVDRKAYQNGKPAPDGRYQLAFMWTVRVKLGIVVSSSVI